MMLVLLLGVATTASGRIISNVQGGSTVSPDGDGIQDSIYIAATFSDSVYSYDAYVLTGDTMSIVDILVDGEPRSAGTDSTWWDGRNFFGSVVSQGEYLFFLRAENASGADSVYRKIDVDVTPPEVTVTQIQPGTLLAPGLDDQQNLLVDYFVSDVFPSDSVNVVVLVQNPSGKKDTLISRLLQTGKTYRAEWDPSNATVDGIYALQIRAKDNGGHLDVAFASINVDLNKPSMHISSPAGNKKFNVIPDSLLGWAYDRNGVKPVQITYGQNRPYVPVPNQWIMDDTLFFSAPLADSVVEEGIHQMRLKTTDAVGRTDSIPFSIELDTSAPDSPVLDSAPGVVHAPKYTLTGTFSQDTKKIRLFRNGTFVDSVVIVIQETLSKEVLLKAGTNVLTAKALDDAGNISAPSNEITVVYENAAGVFIPQPFRANDSFQINLAAAHARVALRIFDLGGNLVYVHRDYTAGTHLDIEWDGSNGEGTEVKRGPLVLVVLITYDNGSEETFREIFLFTP